MDPFENHSFALIRKILSFLGFWHTQTLRERIFRHLIIGFLLMYSICIQLCQMFMLDLDLQSIVFLMQIFIPSFSIAAIYCSFILHFVILRKIFSYIKQDWQRLENDVERKIMERHAYESKLFTLICGFVFFFAGLNTVPVVIRKTLATHEGVSRIYRFLLFTRTDYSLDQEKYYYLISVHQITLATLALVVAIGCYSAYFLVIQHVCALLSIAREEIHRTFENNHHRVLVTPRDLSHWIIKFAQRFARIREFMSLVNNLSEKCYLFQMSLGFSLIVIDFLSLFQMPVLLKHEGSGKDAFAFLLFIVATVFPIYFNCYIGQRLMDYSADVYKEACLLPIHDMSLKAQKLLLITLIMNAKPCTISIGKMFVSSHEFFSELIRSSLSFAMILYSMHKV